MKSKDLSKEIIIRAKAIIDADGTKNLSMRKLANALDIAVGTLYNYYPNKQAVLAKVMEIYWIQFYKNSMEQTKIANGINDELSWFIDQCQDFSLRYQEAWFVEKNDDDKGWQKYIHKMTTDMIKRYRKSPTSSVSNEMIASIVINSAFTMSTIGLTPKDQVIETVTTLL